MPVKSQCIIIKDLPDIGRVMVWVLPEKMKNLHFVSGHGLSYTSYEYSGLKIDSVIPQTQDIEFTFTVKNTGNMAGKETAFSIYT